MWKITEVYDTRSFNPETGKPEPGTGEPHSCDHCGKTHVVYCEIENKSGQRMTVGTTCAKKLVYDFNKITTSALKSAALKKWIAKEAQNYMNGFIQTTSQEATRFVESIEIDSRHAWSIKQEMYEILSSEYSW